MLEIIERIQCLLHGLFQFDVWSKHNCLDVQSAKVLLVDLFTY